MCKPDKSTSYRNHKNGERIGALFEWRVKISISMLNTQLQSCKAEREIYREEKKEERTHENLSQLSLDSFNVEALVQGTCDIVQLLYENCMKMLTKYIILVDSAIPLSEKQCFRTFSITGSSCCMHHTQTLTAHI